MKKYSGAERLFRAVLGLSAIGIVFLLSGIFITLVLSSLPSLKAFGWHMVSRSVWNPVTEDFGALPFLAGTLITSFLALVISLPFAMAIAIYLGEYFKSGFASAILGSMTEILAGIPSVIYGFWGLFVMVPVVRAVEMKLRVPPYGVGLLAAAVILAVMIIPFSASIAREVIQLVPSEIKEAAYSLGATRFEVLKTVIIPFARSGIMAGILLALGRALGETMAVTMVIGNANYIPKSLFSPANTMASVIANEFTEATGTLHLSSLVEIGLLLFVVTAVINFAGTLIIKAMRVRGASA